MILQFSRSLLFLKRNGSPRESNGEPWRRRPRSRYSGYTGRRSPLCSVQPTSAAQEGRRRRRRRLLRTSPPRPRVAGVRRRYVIASRRTTESETTPTNGDNGADGNRTIRLTDKSPSRLFAPSLDDLPSVKSPQRQIAIWSIRPHNNSSHHSGAARGLGGGAPSRRKKRKK